MSGQPEATEPWQLRSHVELTRLAGRTCSRFRGRPCPMQRMAWPPCCRWGRVVCRPYMHQAVSLTAEGSVIIGLQLLRT